MEFNKEQERLEFIDYTNNYTLVPFDNIGLINYRNKSVDFKDVFSNLALRYTESGVDDSPGVLKEAYNVFNSAMKPIAQKRFFEQKDDSPIGYLYLHFMDIKIFLDNGITLSSSPSQFSAGMISFLDMRKFAERTSNADKDSHAWTPEEVMCVVSGQQLPKPRVAPKKAHSNKEGIPSWLIPRSASKTKLKIAAKHPSLA